jgi:hypothetical protein
MAEHDEYREGHLVVAAVRILEYHNHILPREEDVAEFLQWHVDHARVVLRGLRDRGILEEVRSAHDLRLKIADHLELEKLERSQDIGDEIGREMAEFQSRVESEQNALDALFQAGQKSKREKKSKLEKEYESYRSAKPANPFGDEE